MNEEDIKKVEKLIKKCDECKLNECINCEISWTEIASVRRLVDTYKKQQAEIENWKMEYNHWCQLAIDRKIEIEKKDKIIDLMAKDIKEADKFLDSMSYLGEYAGYTIEDIIEEYKKEAEYKIKEDK